MAEIKVVEGDITQIDADGIITAINSSGMWFGGIDGAIQSVAGDRYHRQAAREKLSDLVTVVAKSEKRFHEGEFDHVVFVVDDLESPLDQVIMKGLEAADLAGMRKVLIPAIRTGVMLGVVELDLMEVASKLSSGIKRYFEEHPDRAFTSDTGIKSVTIVIMVTKYLKQF